MICIISLSKEGWVLYFPNSIVGVSLEQSLLLTKQDTKVLTGGSSQQFVKDGVKWYLEIPRKTIYHFLELNGEK